LKSKEVKIYQKEEKTWSMVTRNVLGRKIKQEMRFESQGIDANFNPKF